MSTWIIVILGIALALLFGEPLRCKVSDWLERREVANAWEGCISVARCSAPSWVTDRVVAHQADQLFAHLKEQRRSHGKTLPSHLIGVPVSRLIERCG